MAKKKKYNIKVKLSLAAVVIVGLALLGLGVFYLSNNLVWSRIGQPAQGTVVQIVNIGTEQKPQYRPEIEFPAPSGEVLKAVVKSGPNLGSYEVGDSMEVYYSKQDATKVFIKDRFSNFVFPFLLIGAGILTLLFLLSLVAAAKSRNKSQKKPE